MIVSKLRFAFPLLILLFINAATAGFGATENDRHAIFHVRISPDGTRAVFTYADDIWITDFATGQCTRVTDHNAYDHHPVWFPDGKNLAFSSNRDGHNAVYSVPTVGGIPTRRTWAGSFDIVMDVSPDGKYILFRSGRRMFSIDIFEIPTSLGMVKPVTNDESLNLELRYSPDGKKIVACRGGMSWVRRHYNGSSDADIYVMDRDGTNPHWIENGYDGIDYWPSFSPDGKSVYFVSDRDLDCENIFRIPAEGGPAERITNFKDRPVRWPSVSNTGRICFEQDFRLWVMENDSSTPKAVTLKFPFEPKHSQEVRLDISGNVSEMELSPDGKLMALIVRGELYIAPVNDPDETPPMGDIRYGEAIRITNTPSRERNVQWHPDGDKVALVSDRDGNQEIYEINLRNFEWTRLTNTPEDELAPDYSPDGKFLSFLRGNRHMIVRNIETGAEHTILDALYVFYPYWEGFYWSPDSRWIAYTLNDARYYGEVYIVGITDDGSAGATVNVTRHQDHDSIGGWASDGESIYFVSNRNASMGLDGYGWWGSVTGLYSIPLKRTPPPRSDVLEFPEKEEKSAEAEGDEKIDGSDNSDESEEKSEESDDEVKIDFDRIDERARQVSNTRGSGWGVSLSPDCMTFVYLSDALGSSALWKIPFEGGDAEYLTDTFNLSDIEWAPDGSGFYFLDIGRVKFCNINSGAARGVPTYGRLTVDLTKEREQMISEAGRLLKNNFYDKDMHGIDWDRAVEYYIPFAGEATVPEEFDLLMEMMFGELDASHLGSYGGSSQEGIGYSPAFLGLDFDPSTTGPGLKVTRVWKRGPADYKDTKIVVGEWVLKINETNVSTAFDYCSLLDDAEARTTILTVAEDQKGTNSREVAIGPMSYFEGAPYALTDGLVYLDWVESKRAIVDEKSDNRIAYIHLPNMMGQPLELFARELFAKYSDKDALILDIRWNSGGNIHEELLDILNRPQFGWNRNRDGDERATQPSRMWDRPIVVLINERSFSDAEIFPAGIRALKLATLIGETTSGGVIGTVDLSLVNGVNSMRIPRVGWFTLEGKDLENLGIEPDIRVENSLEHVREGIDDQLNAAIDYLMKHLD
ncbi:MAG: S41 family peptidase [bacterium]